MLKQTALVASLLCGLATTAIAENPWGPECATVDECIAHLKKLPDCPKDDEQCFWSIGESNNGLWIEFRKFGSAGVPPLIEIMKSGGPTQVARSAELLWSLQEYIQPFQQEVIIDAWRRGEENGHVPIRGVTRWSKPLAKRAHRERRSERAACGGHC